MSDASGHVEDDLARGLRLEDQGAFEEALALYRAALDRFPDDVRVIHRIGVMEIRLDRRDEARAAFERALAIQREYAPALTNLGNMALEAGDVDQAVQLYRRAIAVQPEYPGAHHNLGVAYRRQGRLAEAVAEHRLATRHERRYSVEMDKLRMRGTRNAALTSGCLGRSAGLLFVLAAGALLATHLHA